MTVGFRKLFYVGSITTDNLIANQSCFILFTKSTNMTQTKKKYQT